MSMDFASGVGMEHSGVAVALPDAVVPAVVRQFALRQLLHVGMPTLRDDDWRYAQTHGLDKQPFAAMAPGTLRASTDLPERLGGLNRVVFVDGHYSAALSDPVTSLSGVSLTTGADSATLSGFTPERGAHERFGWLNDAFAADVARLVVTSKAELELLFIQSDVGTTHPRIELTLTDNSKLLLVERHLGAGSLVNAAVQIRAGSHSLCQHIRLQTCAVSTAFVDTLQVSMAADSDYQLALVHLGSQSARSSVRVSLDGRGARFKLNGASIADGKRTLDTSVHVQHLAADTVSEQLLRAVARDRSSIGFTSRVEVAATAHESNAQQSLKGLVAATAEVNLRPQLEILTDRVRANHGATTGALDENMLFYLLSRGLDSATARGLLEWAFIESAVSQISPAQLRRQVELNIVEQLGNHAAREALQ
jgi:Fe-S cluster assembly protein SufD